jgi:hypothetical protein
MTIDLRRYWPRGQTGLLMKAAFHSDMGIAAQAWRSWLETCDFDKALWGDLCIASLAHRRFQGSEVAGALAPRLLGLRRYIWSAGQMRIDAARPLLKEFADKNVAFMLIKGSVQLARDPQAISDRVIGDIDVLVDHTSWEKAVDIALAQGWSRSFGLQLDRNVSVHRMRQIYYSADLRRDTCGAVDLHLFSLLVNRQLGADVTLWKRAVPGTLSAIPVVLPHPSDHLAIVFGHCFLFESPRSFGWVADALATISTPGFDWCLFTDAILDRELAVPAATALTYLAEELQRSIPSVVMQRIVGQVREPFLTEFAARYRHHVSEVAEECHAIFQAECIRSRHFIERLPSPPKVAGRKTQINARLNEIRAGQKVVFLPMPSEVRSTDRVHFRLLLEAADEWRSASSSHPLGSSWVSGTCALVLLRCFDGFPLELGRLVVRRKQSGRQELRGEIDGSLVVGSGIDELWLHVTTLKALWFYKLYLRIVRSGTGEAVWHKLRRRRILPGVGASQGAVLRGTFEASIFTSHA